MRGPLLLLVILLAGCASVPHATLQRDVEAKQYITHPGTATLYVFRNVAERLIHPQEMPGYNGGLSPFLL